MDMTQAGIRYILRGVAPLPIWRDKRKNPYLNQYTEFTKRLPTIQEWRRWANRWPGCNIGLITGYWGLIALDFDTVAAYDEWCKGPGFWVKGQTWTVQTARGYHVWFDYQGSDPGESRSYTLGDHEVLLRAKGGYCIVPPSMHHTGARYRTVHKVEPFPVDSIDYYLSGWDPKITPQNSEISKAPNFSQNHNLCRIEDLIPITEGSHPNGRGAYQVRCPFHDDSTPSAWVNIEQQRFGCNVCWPGKWWDVINVLAMKRGISNGEAFLELKKATLP